MGIDTSVKDYDHTLFRLLQSLNVVDEESIELYAPCVRDRDDIPVFRCQKSGVIFLGKIEHAVISHYEDKDVESGFVVCQEQEMPFFELDNAQRQANDFCHLIENKKWLDFGCGSAALLNLLSPRTVDAWGLEPNRQHIRSNSDKHTKIASTLDDISDDDFDIISMFHVFEHLPDPIAVIESLKKKLKPGGLFLIEVPHAKDFLLETLRSREFRDFTLWSEHLVLHTQASLAKILGAAGLGEIEIKGYQRFPVSNHLHWLRHGKPGGHEKWSFLDDIALTQSYANALERLGQTDTIVAFARA